MDINPFPLCFWPI